MDLSQNIFSEDPLQLRVRAQEAAIAATDRYYAAAEDDPRKDALWADVVRLTAESQRLLLQWLDHVEPSFEPSFVPVPADRAAEDTPEPLLAHTV
jgi:hypothetical protein